MAGRQAPEGGMIRVQRPPNPCLSGRQAPEGGIMFPSEIGLQVFNVF